MSSVAEQYSRARHTKDLTLHQHHPCDADVLLASGMSGVKNKFGHDVYRLSYAKQRQDYIAVQAKLIDEINGITESRLISRKLNRFESEQIVKAALFWYLNPVCEYCAGVCFVRRDDAPQLTTEECSACHGTGRKPLSAVVPRKYVRVTSHLIELMDKAALKVQVDIARHLYSRNPTSQQAKVGILATERADATKQFSLDLEGWVPAIED
jgi:hypothetical protein